MRWVAAFMVFGLHIRNVQYFDSGLGGKVSEWLFLPGSTGVSFFYILSGFVLTWSTRPGGNPFTFWRRRFARIYPVHLACALIALALGTWLVKDMRTTPEQWLHNLTLTHAWYGDWLSGDPVSWSLSDEAFFYLSFPLLGLLVHRLNARWAYALAALAALEVILLPWFYLTHPHAHLQPLYFYPPARAGEFVLGAALARLVRLNAWRGPRLDAAFGIAVLLYFASAQFPGQFSVAAVTAIGFSLLICAGAQADLTGAPSFWRHPRLVRLGELSFSFYMVHVMVLRFGENAILLHPRFSPLPAIGIALLAFVVSLGCAWLLYEYVEVPCRKLLLRRWPRPWQRRDRRLSSS
jgi:peptidoglycan/LPS O-acetylase OafA/YrhL